MPLQNPGIFRYQTLLDIDFTSLQNQTLTPGTNTIGGKTFTYANDAGSAAAPAIVNGTGLVIQPNVLTTYDFAGAPVTAPVIRITFANIDSRITLLTPLLVWAYRSSNPTGAGKYMTFGPEKPGGLAQSMYAVFNGNGVASNELAYMVMSNAVSAQQSGTVATDTSITQLQNGIGGEQMTNYIGTYAAGLPLASAVTGFGKGTALVGSAPIGSIGIVADWDIFLTAMNVGAVGTFSAAWGRLRVDALLVM